MGEVDHKFLNVKSGGFGLGSDWLVHGGVRSGFPKALFPESYKMEFFF